MINRRKLVYGFTITFWYLAQFIGCAACINLYSDNDRLRPCNTTGLLSNPEEASKVFDMPLLLLAIFHIIEWIRATFVLGIVCIGVNWMLFWYLTIPNTLYGLVTYAFVHMAYFDEDGQKCAEAQPDRASWLFAEIIAFWVLFLLYAFPFIWTLVMGKDRADATLELWKENQGKEEEED